MGWITWYRLLLCRIATATIACQTCQSTQDRDHILLCISRIQRHPALSITQTQWDSWFAGIILVHPGEERLEGKRHWNEGVGIGGAEGAEGSQVGCHLPRPPRTQSITGGGAQKETAPWAIPRGKPRIRLQWSRVQRTGPWSSHLHGWSQDILIIHPYMPESKPAIEWVRN